MSLTGYSCFANDGPVLADSAARISEAVRSGPCTWDGVQVTDGWEPLCEFLGLDVPDEPLPHANDRDTFLQRVIGGALDSLEVWREQNLTVA